jgi:hypothetical protein
MIIIITIRSAHIGFEDAGIDDDTSVRNMAYESKIVIAKLTRSPDSMGSKKTSGFNRANKTVGAITMTP